MIPSTQIAFMFNFIRLFRIVNFVLRSSLQLHNREIFQNYFMITYFPPSKLIAALCTMKNQG